MLDCLVMSSRRTDKMSALFDDPSGGTVEPVIVTRGEIDNAEEKGISRFDASSRGTSPTFHSCTRSHLSCNFSGFE